VAKNPDPERMNSRTKVVLETSLSALALIVLSPFLFLLGVAILSEDGWPILFSQTRVGRHGKPFSLWKLRSMRKAKDGCSITASGDPRITRVGRVIRKFKLDELPQLWNVVRGEMSLVGPRPELPEFVDFREPTWRSILRVRPGVTDPVSVAYRDEEALLATATDPVGFYREVVLPDKLARNLAYLSERSLWRDLGVILQTVRCAAFPGQFRKTGSVHPRWRLK
jgi:lipopolysaccharide/colanic/teichoic acid biosynthesis glycosyltransferase